MSDVTPLPAGEPRTHEGKQVVRWNATRHGISSPAPVVPGLERTEDWEKHEEGVLESLRPEGHLETVLAERIALRFWRLHRVTRYETGAMTVAQETIEGDIDKREHFMASMRGERLATTHPIDVRFEAKYCKQAHNASGAFPLSGPTKP